MIDIKNLSNEAKINEIQKYLKRNLSQDELDILNSFIGNIYYITEGPNFFYENKFYVTNTHKISDSLIKHNKYCYFIFYDIHQKSSLDGFILRGRFIEDKNLLLKELRDKKIDKIIKN
jgi:hypothetical protein